MSLPAPGAAALAALLAAAPAPAPSPAPEEPLPAAVSLTVSGGASLGAYEAGFLHYLAAARQAGSGQGPEVRLATGASAGSINSLLSLLYTQGGVEPDPYTGLFAKVWLDTGFRELFLPDRATALGAFSGASLSAAAERVRARLEQGLPETVDVVLGVAATRVTPRQRSLAGGRTSIPRTEEKFVLRIQGRGPGRMPRITSYPEADLDEEQIVLPSQPDGTVSFDDVKALLLASAAFPVAFQPQSVRHCMVRTRGGRPPWCPAAEATSALFLDGGVFDSAPLRLAAWLAAAGLTDGPDGLRWRDAPTPDDVRPPRHVTFAFLSAEARDYPGPAATSPARPTESLPRLLGEEAAAFVTTARSKELDGLLTDFPHVAEGLVFPQRHIPAASEPLQAFFGFFERSFREFDFTLGMYEARRQLLHETTPRYRKRWGVGGPSRPEAATADARPWRPLLCMQAVLDGESRADALCSGEDLSTFRILLQVSLERLWSACQPSPPRIPPPSSFRSCAPVLSGRPLPAVPGVTPAADFARREGESDAVHVVRLLAAHGFTWTDMGMGRASEEQALAGLREQLGRVAGTLAARQPDLASRSAVGVAGRLAADAFHYQPPRSALWLLFGRGLEIGGSTAVIDEGWFRLGGALILQNLLGAMSSDPTRVGLMPVAGVDFVPGSWGSTVFQPSFQVRAGYLFDFSDAGCTGTDGLSIGACSRGELEAGAAVTVISVIRFQLSFQWYPPARGAPGLWALAPSLGLQLGF